MKRVLLLCLVIVGIAGAAFASGGQETVSKTQGDDGFLEVTAGEITVSCRMNEGELELELSAPTTGWIAVGFEPSSMMKDANIIIGAVVDGEVAVEDHFGVSLFAHKPDTDLGGTKDVTPGSGSESDGRTTFSFSVPYDTGDAYDVPLVSGDTVQVILAYGNRDNFRNKHSYRTKAEITVE